MSTLDEFSRLEFEFGGRYPGRCELDAGFDWGKRASFVCTGSDIEFDSDRRTSMAKTLSFICEPVTFNSDDVPIFARGVSSFKRDSCPRQMVSSRQINVRERE
jgi:hypothetical protein